MSLTAGRVAVLVAGLLILLSACSGETKSDDVADPSSPEPRPSPTPSRKLSASPPQTEKDHEAVTDDLSDVSQEALDRRLIDAAWDNALGRARRLVGAGADVNAKDDTVQSAYLISTSEGYLDLLELTLRNGARVNSKDSFNGTGLIRAADRGHHVVAGRLIQAGIEIDHVNNLGWTALHEAIILGDGSQRYVDTVRVLVASGADVELPSRRDGTAPLEHANTRGYDEIATTLRKAANRPGVENPNAMLLRAAADGDADGVALALREGAKIETRDAQGRAPLLLAVTNDNLAAARLLVALGANRDALDGQHDR